MAATLIIIGSLWVFYATVITTLTLTGAMSNAMQFEANLKRWTSEKVHDGRLDESDVREIFPEGYTLRIGGENPNKNFQEWILDIARSGALPLWPGVLSVLIGGAGAVSWIDARKNKRAKQGGSGQPATTSESK